MNAILNFLFHLDNWLQQIILIHPISAYVLIFTFVFVESAVFPLAFFLPGDGLLFSIGVLAAEQSFNLWLAIPILFTGGVFGTRLAFQIGRRSGYLILRFFPRFNQDHIKQAHEFYEKHGSMAFIFSRFMPVIRAIIPLIAGIAKMANNQFWIFNLLSVSLWVLLITFIGFELGHLPFIKHYFSLIILGISAISLMSVTIVGIRQQNVKGKF